MKVGLLADAPICLDLFCGSGGWASGFISVGYRVIGFDIVPQMEYPGELIIQSVTTIDPTRFEGIVDVLVASPPCQEFSRHDQPWTLKRNPPPPDMTLVEATRRLRDAIKPRIFIMENVRGAQRWLGKAAIRRGSFYLWGDICLLSAMNLPQKQRLSSSQSIQRAKIPFQLAHQVASLCKNSLSKEKHN